MFGFRSLRAAFAAAGMLACAAVQAAPFAYVPNEKSGSVSVIDSASGAAVRTIAAGKRPRGIAADPQGALLYVTDTANALLVLDAASGAILARIAVAPGGGQVWVSNRADGSVMLIDTAGVAKVAEIAVGQLPWGVVIR